MKSFYALLESAIENNKIEDAIIDFLSNTPNPKDPEIHDLADDLGIEHSEFESKIYQLLADFFSSGRWNQEGRPQVDPDELDKGIEIESEHSTSRKFQERIAKDHLAEIHDYYSRLEKMEGKAEKGLSEASSDLEKLKDEASTTTDADGEMSRESESDVEDKKEDTTQELGIEDKYIWNIESYTMLGIRQVYVYVAEDRISYDTYKADPYNMILYVNKKYGADTFKSTMQHLNKSNENFTNIEIILDNDGLKKEVVDFIIDKVKELYEIKVSIV